MVLALSGCGSTSKEDAKAVYDAMSGKTDTSERNLRDPEPASTESGSQEPDNASDEKTKEPKAREQDQPGGTKEMLRPSQLRPSTSTSSLQSSQTGAVDPGTTGARPTAPRQPGVVDGNVLEVGETIYTVRGVDQQASKPTCPPRIEVRQEDNGLTRTETTPPANLGDFPTDIRTPWSWLVTDYIEVLNCPDTAKMRKVVVNMSVGLKRGSRVSSVSASTLRLTVPASGLELPPVTGQRTDNLVGATIKGGTQVTGTIVFWVPASAKAPFVIVARDLQGGGRGGLRINL